MTNLPPQITKCWKAIGAVVGAAVPLVAYAVSGGLLHGAALADAQLVLQWAPIFTSPLGAYLAPKNTAGAVSLDQAAADTAAAAENVT